MTKKKTKVDEIWDKALGLLKERLPESCEVWVKNFVPHAIDGNEFSVLYGQQFAILSITPHLNIFSEVLSEIIGQPTTFKTIYDSELAKLLEKKAKTSKKEEIENKYEGLKQMHSAPNLNLKFTFDNFVVGSNSELAYAGAMAVAKNPGKTTYNPLFIYGNPGVGKTHLIQAIGHYTLNKGLRVKYCTSEDFVNDYVNAVAKGLNKGRGGNNDKMNLLRQKYRNCDVFLMDDVQFLGNKTQTKDELFNTFNSLYDSGKQIVLTSDRIPKDMGDFDERFRSRFQGGLMVELQPPEMETRMAILQNLSKEENMQLSSEIIEFLAINYCTNVRELKGAFNNLELYYSVNQKPLTLEIVKKVLRYKENVKNYSPETIISEVAKYYNVSENDILGTGRMKIIANARQVAIYMIRELTNDSYPSIGQIFNKKHSTILYSYEQAQKQ
ncbi:chromosomal replication initiator protein DnaA, partial [bacterium]|nr:chromosomal replication initiator protein DnaA [bacterium]